MAVLLINPYFLGDSILLEPIAHRLYDDLNDEIYIVSDNPELFIGHPFVKGIRHGEEVQDVDTAIDFGEALRSLETINTELTPFRKSLLRLFPKLKSNTWFSESYEQIKPNKIARIYEMGGLDESDIIPPKLYLTEEEQIQSDLLRELFDRTNIGVVLNSRHAQKDYPYTNLLIKELLRCNYNIFIIGLTLDNQKRLTDRNYRLFHLINMPIRKVMIWISAMDLVVGPDTGILHVAGALEVPTTVITRQIWSDIHAIYPRCDIIYSLPDSPDSIKSVSVDNVISSVKAQLGHNINIPAPSIIKRREIVIFRLDGLGGTLTSTDQAKKIYDVTGIKSTLVVRNYKDIFIDHPYINRVIEVGYVNWDETLKTVLGQFDTVAEVRFGIGKWHQLGEKIFNQDFDAWQGIFDKFPLDYRDLEIHKLHHVLLTDKTLGLPYDNIESKVYYYEEIKKFNLPKGYIIVQDGVDIQHQGMRQTKSWDGWDDLVKTLDYPIVQSGTTNDSLIDGINYDLRSKTTLGELATLVRDAKGIICTEGGFMHLAYAVENPNVIVLRGPTRGKLFEYPGQTLIDSYLCDNCWSMTDDWYVNCPRNCDAVCMSSISAGRVAYNLERMLDK